MKKDIIYGAIALAFGFMMDAITGEYNPIIIYGMLGYCVLKHWDIDWHNKS